MQDQALEKWRVKQGPKNGGTHTIIHMAFLRYINMYQLLVTFPKYHLLNYLHSYHKKLTLTGMHLASTIIKNMWYL